MPDPTETLIIETPPNEAIDADGKTVQLEARIEGEEEPDFTGLGADPDAAPPEPAKPATSPPNAKPEALKDEPLPPDAGDKPKDEVKPPEETKKADEPAKTDATKAPEIPKDDADLDAMKLKPGTSPKLGQQFDAAKEQARIARQAARALQAERDAVAAEKAALEEKLKTIKPLDEATEKTLKELQDFRQQTLLENDPELVKEFTDKQSAVEDKIVAQLIAVGVPEETAKEIRAKGISNYPGKWWKEQILDKVDDPLQADRLRKLLLDREQIFDDKRARVAGIAANKEELVAKQTAAEKARWDGFSQEFDGRARALTKDMPWAHPVEITAAMTPAEKAAAETHNAEYKKAEAEYLDTAQKIVSLQHPTVLAEVMCRAFELPHVKAALDTAKADLEKERTRSAELEEQIAAINKTGKLGDKRQAPPAKRQAVTPPENETAEEAMERYEREAAARA